MPLELKKELIEKYNQMLPRYTSYPTAPEWGEIDITTWQQSIDQANASNSPVSLYFHIPFCRSACYYCACNMIISPKGQLTEPYLSSLKNEISFIASKLNPTKKVEQIHFGGGTPTYLTTDQLRDLLDHISCNFNLATENVEFSIEVDPRVTTREQLALLREYNFTRVSMGVQDFNPDVQEAINRIQSQEIVEQLVRDARELGYQSVNFDLIYGLPLQTLEGFEQTIEQVSEISPDRIALFNYAHLPSLRPYQKAYIKDSELPKPEQKLTIFQMAISKLQKAGYQYIGLDHFAKEQDELSIAYRENQLHRNFQGYSTRGELDMFALGTSSISWISGAYYQNTKAINQYLEHYGGETIPETPLIEKGYTLSEEDLIRYQLIRDILCRNEIDLDDYSLDLNAERGELNALTEDGLIEFNEQLITINPIGKLFLRNIASIFDTYLRAGREKRLFSRSV